MTTHGTSGALRRQPRVGLTGGTLSEPCGRTTSAARFPLSVRRPSRLPPVIEWFPSVTEGLHFVGAHRHTGATRKLQVVAL